MILFWSQWRSQLSITFGMCVIVLMLENEREETNSATMKYFLFKLPSLKFFYYKDELFTEIHE